MMSFPNSVRLALAAFLSLSWTVPGLAQEAAPEAPATEPQTAEEVEASYRAAFSSVEADLASELQKLAELRQQIGEEKPPLAKETNTIAAEIREKRHLARLAEQERDALIHDLNELSNRVRVWRDEKTYVASLLEDYRKQFESRLSLAELVSHEAELEKARQASSADSALTERLAIAELGLNRLKESLGGHVVAGQALGTDGTAVDGQFVLVGPVAWFTAEKDGLGGLVNDRKDLRPEVVPDSASPKAIAQLASGEEANATLDPSLGTALTLRENERSLVEHIREGGFWIYPILFLALVATLAALYKWLQISRFRELRPDLLRSVIDAVNRGDRARAREDADRLRHPAAILLKRGVEVADHSRDFVEEALYEKYMEAQPGLQRGLPFIAIASATAPLLGLLGTVTGMIHTFQRITVFGTGDAQPLASGISEALVTTEFGLIVAIPALILHALLSRKVQGILSSMEMASLAFVNGLHPEAGGESSASVTGKAPSANDGSPTPALAGAKRTGR